MLSKSRCISMKTNESGTLRVTHDFLCRPAHSAAESASNLDAPPIRISPAASPATTPARYNGIVPIQLIAMDLDGTLLHTEGHIPAANARAIREAAARGVEIVIVTGRRFTSARMIAAAAVPV